MRRIGLMLVHLALAAGLGLPVPAWERVPVPTAVTGQIVGNLVLGSSPFPAPPGLDPITDTLLLTVDLSGGPAPHAVLRLPRQGGEPEVVAYAGAEVAPGLRLSRFLPAAGCNGRTVFWAGLDSTGGSASADSGLFLAQDAAVQQVALTGGPAPGGGLFAALGSAPGVDSDGRMVFLSTTTDSSEDLVLFNRTASGTLSRLLSAGDVTVEGTTVEQILDAQLGCDGSLLVSTVVASGGDWRQTLLRETAGLWVTLLAEGTPLADGSTVQAARLPATLSGDGTLHVVADRGSPEGPALLMISASGSLTLGMRAGDLLPDGATIREMGRPTPWSSQRMALRVTVTPAHGGPDEEVLVHAGRQGDVQSLLAPGDTDPQGNPVAILGDPVGAGNQHLHLRVSTAGSTPMTGLLSLDQGMAWHQLSGDELIGWGFFMAGGFRSAKPDITASGEAVFLAAMPGGQGAQAAYLGRPGQTPRLLVAPGQMASDGSSIQTLNGPPAIATDTTVWLAASLGSPRDAAAYLEIQEGVPPAVVLAEGDPSPAGGTFRTLGRVPSATAGGDLVFTATLNGAGTASGVFTLPPSAGTLALVTAGMAAPGGGDFASFGFAPSAAGGIAVFRAFTSGERVGSGLYKVDLSQPASSLAALLTSGSVADGGGLFQSFGDPLVSENGTVAFTAILDDGSRGLFTLQGSVQKRLLLEGDSLPDGEVVETLADFAVDDSGDVYALASGATGTGDAWLLDFSTGTAAILLRAGTGLPLPAAALRPVAGFSAVAAAGPGHVAATADIAGWSPGAAVIHAVEDGDQDGWGDPVDCAPGDSTAWAVPGLLTDLTLAASEIAAPQLSWTQSSPPPGPGTSAEILTGTLHTLQQSGMAAATCALSGIQGHEAVLESSPLQPGQAHWFLVRGRNVCGAGPVGPASEPRQPPAELCSLP